MDTTLRLRSRPGVPGRVLGLALTLLAMTAIALG